MPLSPTERYELIVSESAGVRYLHFGSEWVQGAMRVSDPDRLELEYTRHLMAGLAMTPQGPQSTLQIGLGAGSISKFLLRHVPEAKHTVIEIDRRLPAYVRQHFALASDAPLRIVVADAREWCGTARQRHDLIVLDGFDEEASAGELVGAPFLSVLRRLMTAEGLLAINLFGQTRRYNSALRAILTVFPVTHVVAMPVCQSGNVVLFASNQLITLDRATIGARARGLRDATGLAVASALQKLYHVER
jgi:spermidine synthase